MTRRYRPGTGIVRILGLGGALIALAVLLRFNLLQPVTQTANDTLAPVQGTLTEVSLPGLTALESAQDAATLRTTIEQQRAVIDQLNAQIVRAREIELENQRLREELDYRQANPGFEVQRAELVGQDPTNLVRSITINKGERDGIKVGMIVVDGAGALVGRVTQITPGNAKVLLLTDTSVSVYAMVQNPSSRAVGLVEGLFGPYLRMRLIPQVEEVQRGDVIITSGRGPNFPKGIYVGRVLEVNRTNADAFQEAVVEPAARLGRLETVLVIMNFLPQRPDS
jgi:rod shape-determining protein MreC